MFTAPIYAYQDAQAELAKPVIKEYQAALSAWEAEREGILSSVRAAAKAGKPVDKLRADLIELERDKPESPRVPKLIREDLTPEGLAKKLQKEWPSAGVISNEAGIVFGAHGMNRESVMRNLALLNKLWDGGRYQSDRADDERSRDVRGARLTMGLMIQESTLRAFFDASKGLARGTGFLARFLPAWPDSRMGTRFYTPPVPGNPALAEFHRRITALLNRPVPIDDDGVLTPPVLPLTPEAKEAWIEFHDTIEKELGGGGEYYDVKDVAAKTADNAVRLAALFQVFEHGMGGAVGLECFESASLIAAWHLHEARRFFGEIALPAELADAARLDRWLIEYCQRERTHIVGKNDVRQCGPLRDGARLDAAIRELAELDRLRLEKNGKRLTIHLNPALLGVAP
jgi:putative DNA primase/helicase